MIKFKSLKYKHRIAATKLFGGIKPDGSIEGETLEETLELQAAVIGFVMSLVDDWDLVDVETGELVPVGEPDELTDEQLNEVINAFKELSEETGVKKQKVDKYSSSSRTPKKVSR